MAYNYTSWDALLYKSKSGGYRIKASAARKGATMKGAMAALGAAPAKYNGKIRGYNPNLVRSDKELAKDLGMNVKKEEATLNALAKEKNANALTNMQATPVQYAENAMVSNAADYRLPEPTAPTPTRSLQATYSTPTTEKGVAGPSWNTRYSNNPGAAAAYDEAYLTGQQLGWSQDQIEAQANRAAEQKIEAQKEFYANNIFQVEKGWMSQEEFERRLNEVAQTPTQQREFPNDPEGQAVFDREYANNIRNGMPQETAYKDALSKANDGLFRTVNTGLNDFLTNNPIGKVLAPVLQAGIGVTAGAAAGKAGVAAHFGAGMPATPGPDPAGFLPNNYGNLDNATANSTVPREVSMPTINPLDDGRVTGAFGTGLGTSNNLGYTPINAQTLGTGAAVPAAVGLTGNLASAAGSAPKLPENPAAQPPGIPSVESGGQMGTMNGGTGSTSGAIGSGINTGNTGSTGTGTNTGTGTGAAASGDWWENPAALAAMVAALQAGGSIVAGNQQAAAAGEAAGIQSAAMDRALAEQKRQFDAQQTNLKPWLEAGGRALTELENFDQNNPAFSFTQDDPSYTFRFNEGLKALQNSAAARGTLLSGNTMRSITDYGQQAASQEYQNAFNRYQTTRGQKLNRIQSLAGVGQSAVQQANSAGQNYANSMGNLVTGQGQAQAQGMTDAAGAKTMGWVGAGNAILGGLNNYYIQKQSQDMMGLVNSFLRR